MLSVMALLRSKRELTAGDIDTHVSDTAGQGGAAPAILGRVFNHVVDRTQKGIDYTRSSYEPDAIAQFFFADISSSMTAANSGTMKLTMGLPDSLVEDMQVIVTLQNTIIAPPAGKTGVKRMSTLRKRPDVSSEAFQAQWFDLHAVLVKRLPGIMGYRQNLVIDGARDAKGNLLVDGMVEIWVPDAETIESAFRSDIGITTMTHAKEFIAEINTYIVDPRALSGVF